VRATFQRILPGMRAPLAMSTTLKAATASAAFIGWLKRKLTAVPVTLRASAPGRAATTCAPSRVVNEKLVSPPSGLPRASRAFARLTA